MEELRGIGYNENSCVTEKDMVDIHNGGRPPRPRPASMSAPTTVSIRGCITRALICEVALASDSEGFQMEFQPVYRSGVWSDTGLRRVMEDAHVRIDDLETYLGSQGGGEASGAFYGVFDGHGGKDAAFYVKENVLQYILDDIAFPTAIEDAVKSAFLRLDDAFANACSVDHDLSSGTTALTAFLSGRNLLVANAGDCRAVLCRRGKAVEMSRDHKPGCLKEKLRIEKLGGYVDDGYLNGQLAVARAIGDWHMTGLKGQGLEGPLSAEPEIQHVVLTEEDEFLVIGCDGLWDVFTSQNAVDFARKELQLHNDPEHCSRELVAEALKRRSSDNLTVVTVCFKTEPPPRLAAWRPRVRRSFSVEGISNLQGFLNDCPPIEKLSN
ncbi:unnamed protein product [Sphagnum troendelagicum]|uniref:protein-serine/threonine phosphatase n=1 Tax=Sphagnum troendelagicum TaxID=128251 RepID=A0ABP0UGH3_9BRYO